MLIAAVAGVVGYLIVVPPVDLIRDQLVAQVKAKTGRTLTIAGPTKLSFYPSIAVKMQNVSLSPPPGMPGAPMVKMEQLDASVKLLPLLKREVTVERLLLNQPVIDLRVDKQGRKTWDFAEAVSDPVRYAQAPSPTKTDARPVAQAGPASIAKLEQLQLNDVRIEKGAVRYLDERSGVQHNFSAVNLALALKSIANPLDAKGDFVWRGQKVGIDAKLATVRALMEERPAKLSAKLNVPSGTLNFDGTVGAKDAIDVDGTIDTKSPSVRQLAKWLGTELPPARGFGPASIAGQLKATPANISLTNANIGLDGATATGQLAIALNGPRPHIRTNLQVSELDLNKYLVAGLNREDSTPAKPGQPATAAPTAPAAAKPAKPDKAEKDGEKKATPGADAIEELLRRAPGSTLKPPLASAPEPAAQATPVEPVQPARPGPQVKGYTQRAGWSEDALKFAALGAADVDAKLAVGRLLYDDIKVGQSQLTVALKNSVLKTNLEDVSLYGGRGRGFVTVDATNKSIGSVGINLIVDGVDALPLLKDAAEMDWLSGKGKLELAVAGQGANQMQIADTLNGKADFTFANGAIVGWNIPGLVRNLQQGKFSGLGKSPSEKTDFSEFAASFAIAQGIATNQDLRLTSPLLRVGGAGRVLIGARQLDYQLRPKIVASLDGQGGAQGLGGLEIPVKLTGPWEKPKIEPDLGGVLKDPNQAIGAIKEIGKNLKGKNVNEALKNVLPKGADGQTVKPSQLLDQLLKK